MASLLPTPPPFPSLSLSLAASLGFLASRVTQTPYRPLRPPLPPTNEGRPRWPSWMESYWTKKMSKKLVMGVRSLCAVGSWVGERDRAGGRVDDENWKLKKGGCEGLLALYWSIALPCFALLSYYNVESPLVVPRYPLRGRVRLII